ncbi:MAG: class I SAM-dependent methyltransferase [Thermodesulfobacteriota bacterium]
METGQFAPPLGPEAYARCFATFRSISNEWQAMLKWSGEVLPGLLPAKEQLSILSVGSGTGEFDVEFARLLQAKFKSLQYVTIEPNLTECRQLQSRIAASHLDKIQFEIDPVAFENFPRQQRFDLILFSHCLYYLPDRDQALTQARDLLLGSGLLLIFHQTPQGIDQIQQRFMRRVKGDENEMFTSREIQAILEGHRLPYRLEVLESFLDVTSCFQPDSPTGRELLSFFLESDVRQVRPELQQEIVAYLKEISFPNQERRLLYHPVAVFCLFAPKATVSPSQIA